VTRAAVCTALDRPLEVLELELEPPRAGEVRVRVGATAICGSDLAVQSGSLPSPLPIVLGHQGAGVVVEAGPGVERLSPGAHVVITGGIQCGECHQCRHERPYLCEQGNDVLRTGGLIDGTPRFATPEGAAVHQFVGTGTFAEEVVVSEACVVEVPAGLDFAALALIGCGIITGAGAALNTASIRAGDTVAVIGCGNVGLAALQGARLAGAAEIIAVDLLPAKLELGAAVGAGHTIDARDGDPVGAVRELTGGRGSDVTIEAVGAQATVDQAIAMTASGGEVVFVGAGAPEVRIDVPQFTGLVARAKTFKGCLFGDADIRRDVTRLVGAYVAGQLELDAMISARYGLDEINDGFAAMRAAEIVAGVIEF
jgi:Zn-dependent alcohol dehydrogenase